MHIKTKSAEETRALGMRLSSHLRPGDVLTLHGEMGAGKSELARGIARGLGVSGPVPSPSFTILNLYEDCAIPLRHFDWYRLESSEELYEGGFDEWIGGEGITLIEWPERAPDCLPECLLQIRIEPETGEGRRISLVPRGGFHELPDFQTEENA